MKKLIILFIAITLAACSKDEGRPTTKEREEVLFFQQLPDFFKNTVWHKSIGGKDSSIVFTKGDILFYGMPESTMLQGIDWREIPYSTGWTLEERVTINSTYSLKIIAVYYGDSIRFGYKNFVRIYYK
jgi:hypothetical protein